MRESGVRFYSRHFPATFAAAHGSILRDNSEADYVDFFSSGGVMNYGHNDVRLKKALSAYLEADGIVHGLDFATGARKRFLDLFERLILNPRNLDYLVQFPGPTGTNANEAALKLARLATGRTNVIAFTNSYHGLTAGSLGVTANTLFRNEAYVSRLNVSFLPYCGYFGDGSDTFEYLRRTVEDPGSGVDLPAAVILETVQAEGGVNVASREWLQNVQGLCREHDILLVVDEIQTGVGRTGGFFSFEDAGLKPDIVTLAKSLSGFGLPLAIVLIRPGLDRWQPGEHAGTFRGNNLAFVTGSRSLEIFWQDDALSRSVIEKGTVMAKSLGELQEAFPDTVCAVRGRGMIRGLELHDSAMARLVLEECFSRRVLLELCGARSQVIKVSPPLTIEGEMLRQGLQALRHSVEAIASGNGAALSQGA
jgi:diaminobutyrate-2-oxoglutarate transaminase